MCYGLWGARHGASALAGGSIGCIANLYMTLTALRPGGGAGLVLGARVPIALTSRADGPSARVASALLAVLAAYDARRERTVKAAALLKD